MSESAIDQLVASLKSKTVKVTPSGKTITVGNLSLRYPGSIEEYVKIFEDVLEQVTGAFKVITTQPGEIFAAIVDSQRIDPGDVYLTQNEDFPITDTYVLIDPLRCKSLLLYNHVTKQHEEVHRYYLKDHANLPKGLKPEIVHMQQLYNPSIPSGFTQTESGAIWNTHSDPEYLVLTKKYKKAKCPKLILKFLKHLFPKRRARLHVLQWMTALVSDFEITLPVLVLCGLPGIGKNTLVESIMVGLVGVKNYHKSSQMDRFNNSISNCVLHFMDEGEVSGVIKRNLKNFHELYVAIERKGVDIADPERIFARFVVATNSRRDIQLDYNDRKFSVPELTDVKLLKAFTDEEAAWLFNFKNDAEAQRDFYDYLTENYAPTREAYHGPLFEQICYESLPGWFRAFLTMVEEGEEFSMLDFRKRCGIKKIYIYTVKDQVEQYEHQKGRKVVEIRSEEGMDFFTPIKYEEEITVEQQ